MLKVVVKWGKEKYDVELDTEEPPIIFKSQIFAITGVPPDHQKIMGVKGGVLKDDADWKTLGIKEGHSFMMIGTAPENIPKQPEKGVFVEDEVAGILQPFTTPYSPGLVNLGNTCYMNSALQCLLSIPELRRSVKGYQGAASAFTTADRTHSLTSALKDLAIQLDNSNHAIGPLLFLQTLRKSFPQFSQQDDSGRFAQQDAEECWSSIINCLDEKLVDPSKGSLSNIFGGEFTSTMKNTESADEPSQSEISKFLKLECHISGTTNHLIDGLKEKLLEKIEKNSETLGRQAIYHKTNKISKLPFILNIQFVRFLWKKDVQKKAKILRPVSFPMVLDLFDLCSDELKQQLLPRRAQLKKLEDERLEKERELKRKKVSDSKTEEAKTEQKNEDQKEMEIEKEAKQVNDSAFYELSAVLSHKGRYADSGHYVAWVKEKDGLWLKYDDEQVIPVHEEDVKKLSGSEGGDSHIAYLCIYKSKA